MQGASKRRKHPHVCSRIMDVDQHNDMSADFQSDAHSPGNGRMNGSAEAEAQMQPRDESVIWQHKLKFRDILQDSLSWIFRVNFYRVVWAFYLLAGLVGGAIIFAFSPNMSYLDCIFLAVSAVTSTGLSTVDMGDIRSNSFVVMYLLMFIGGSLILQFVVMLYRIFLFRRLRPHFHGQIIKPHRMTPEEDEMYLLLQEKEVQQRGLIMVCWAFFIHFFLFIFVGTFVLYGIDKGFGPIPGRDERGFSKLWTVSFLTMSSFKNAGFTLTAENMIAYQHRPGVYVFVCVLILAGNTAAPLFLRGIVRVMHTYAETLRLDKEGLRFALSHPRLMTTGLFDSRQTFILLLITFMINVVEYIFFLGSSLDRPSIQALGDDTFIAGIGFFQTVSTRNAGLQIMDLRLMNRGMLVVYIIMMYISAAPFVRTMYVSEQTDKGGRTRQSSVEAYNDFQKQYLFRHTSFLILFFLVLAFAEDASVNNNSSEGLFDVMFEVVSAYGNVGISMGYPGVSYSLVGKFSKLGKFIIMLIMMMGKTRGLPTNTDIVLDFQLKGLTRALKNVQHVNGESADVSVRSVRSSACNSLVPPSEAVAREEDGASTAFARVSSIAKSLDVVRQVVWGSCDDEPSFHHEMSPRPTNWSPNLEPVKENSTSFIQPKLGGHGQGDQMKFKFQPKFQPHTEIPSAVIESSQELRIDCDQNSDYSTIRSKKVGASEDGPTDHNSILDHAHINSGDTPTRVDTPTHLGVLDRDKEGVESTYCVVDTLEEPSEDAHDGDDKQLDVGMIWLTHAAWA